MVHKFPALLILACSLATRAKVVSDRYNYVHDS